MVRRGCPYNMKLFLGSCRAHCVKSMQGGSQELSGSVITGRWMKTDVCLVNGLAADFLYSLTQAGSSFWCWNLFNSWERFM